MKRNLRIDEVAEILACSRRSVYRLLENGELEGFRVKSDIRITPESVETFRQRQVSRFREEIGMG